MIKQNSTRIWDIGDLEYRVIAEFLHELPMEQLAEIEGASPVRITALTWNRLHLADVASISEKILIGSGSTFS